MRTRQRGVLIAVLWINAVMFVVELGAGVYAGSSALVADSLDNLGDAFVFALSLYVMYRSARWRAGAALVKGLVQLAFGIGVLVYVAHRIAAGEAPVSSLMVIAASAALIANLTCFALLMRHRRDDINMRSVWLCSRNDVISNAGVIVAAGAVALTASHWPDVIVGGVIAAVFLQTGVAVIRDSLRLLCRRHGRDRARTPLGVARSSAATAATTGTVCGYDIEDLVLETTEPGNSATRSSKCPGVCLAAAPALPRLGYGMRMPRLGRAGRGCDLGPRRPVPNPGIAQAAVSIRAAKEHHPLAPRVSGAHGNPRRVVE